MTNQGSSIVEEVEFGPSDHSSALQLLSLGKPRTPVQQPQPPLKQDDGELQLSTPTTRALEQQPRRDSPIATHGRHHKKRRMLEAQAAASTILRENQIMVSSNNVINGSEEANANKNSSSHTEAAVTLSGFGATADMTKDFIPDAPFNDKNRTGSTITDQAEGSPSTRKKSITPMSSKNRGKKRRSGSRRHASLPMNHQKKDETKEGILDDHSEFTEEVKKKKSSSKRKSNASKSSSQQTAAITKEYVDNPTNEDILLGMRKFNSHPGNAVYRETVRKFQPQMKAKGRTEVARDIIDHIYNVIGGRFLKVDLHDRWEVMPHMDVMTKVGKAIVELRNKTVPASKKSPKSSGFVSVLESLKEEETPKSTSRPKRKASLGRKVNDFMDETAPSITFKKKKPNLPVVQKKIARIAQGESKPSRRIVEVDRTFEEYIYNPDPSEYYVEETAHLYHNPPFPSEWTDGVTIENLRPIPPPPPLPSFPETDSCKWSFDESSRILIADFSVGENGGQPLITVEDSKFLFEMHERTDITVISRGLLNMSKIDSSMWNLDYLRKCVGREFYHKFRRFDRIVNENGMEAYTEKDDLYSMRFADYVEYCEKRELHMTNVSNSSIEEEPMFDFEDHLGKMHSVGVGTSALYMIDLDIKRLTPLLNRNFLESFELPAVLPGGSHCMMNSVTPDARPFMGPNLYVTPPASFTHFHQDGHGTVDSGHLCISGFNEVVMLCRLTERHKKHALWILSGKKPGGFHFDGLYSMPHGDGLGEKPSWPKTDMIEECEKMGYCPSVFTLEPGDLVHINKGRLHAFRKMSTSKLPEWDCHAQQRRNLIESKGMAGEEKLCVSVAWDWMYRGVTAAGINREVSTVLEASALNRRNGVTSLAIPELSLLQMAKSIPAKSLTSTRGISFLGALEKKKKKDFIYESTKEEICRGIYPGLCVVVGQHVRALNVKESTSTEKGARLSIAKIPDTQENPQTCPLDPYGDSDFECKLCRKELSNVYFHCDGCEKLLSKDFNICRGCHLQGKFKLKIQMHPSNPKRHATLNHMGDNKFSRQSRCPCKNGPACNYCGYCLGCSCRCHSWFTMRTRLCNAEDEEKLLQTVKDTAVVKTALKPAVTEGIQTVDIFEADEPIKYLSDRLKDAGDDELLNEDKNDDSEVKDGIEKILIDDNTDEAKEKDEVSQSDIKKSHVKEDKNDNEKVMNEDKKDKAQAIGDSDENLPSVIKKEDVKEEENGKKILLNEQKKDKVKSSQDNGESLQSGIKMENVDEDENGGKKVRNGKKDDAKANEDSDKSSPNGIKKENVNGFEKFANEVLIGDTNNSVCVKEIGDDDAVLM